MKKNFKLYLFILALLFIRFKYAICSTVNTPDTSNIVVENKTDNRYEYIFKDKKGNVLFVKNLRKFYGFSEGVSTVVLMNWDYAILDENGNISESHFQELGQFFSEGKNYAKFLDGTTGFIDVRGNELFKIHIAEIDGFMAAISFSKGKSLIKQSDSIWIMINESGKELKKYKIQYAENFSCGLSRVIIEENGQRKYNYITYEGNYLSDSNFDYAETFYDDVALVKKNKNDFYINVNGKLIEK